jgi:hypothetical protein
MQLRLYLNHLLTREDKAAIRMVFKKVGASTFEGLTIDGIAGGFEAWGTSKEVAAPDNLATPLRKFRAPETELKRFLTQLRGTASELPADHTFQDLQAIVEAYNRNRELAPTLALDALPQRYRNSQFSLKEEFLIRLGYIDTELCLYIGSRRTVYKKDIRIATARWYLLTGLTLEARLDIGSDFQPVRSNAREMSDPLRPHGAAIERMAQELVDLRSRTSLQDEKISQLSEQVSKLTMALSVQTNAFTDLNTMITGLLESFQSQTATQTGSMN